MKEVLYISELAPGMKSGGGVAEYRNYNGLRKFFHVKESSVYIQDRTSLQKAIDLLCSPVPALYSRKQIREIKKIINNSKAKIVFIETSSMGIFAKHAKRRGKFVISFFHNCEYELARQVRSPLLWGSIKKQEKETICFSDCLLFLNERDIKQAKKLYNIPLSKKIAVLPFTMRDSLSEGDENKLVLKPKGKKGLFVGSDFAPNYNGIKWFVDNVAPYIDCSIDVVGLNFERHTELRRSNVNIIGTVEDIKPYMLDSDFVIFPIFQGSGMKVKTCEALMYGKQIFATDEAVNGYKIEKGAFNICNSPEEFIISINNYMRNDMPIFNRTARKLYISNYSDENFLKEFSRIISYCEE